MEYRNILRIEESLFASCRYGITRFREFLFRIIPHSPACHCFVFLGTYLNLDSETCFPRPNVPTFCRKHHMHAPPAMNTLDFPPFCMRDARPIRLFSLTSHFPAQKSRLQRLWAKNMHARVRHPVCDVEENSLHRPLHNGQPNGRNTKGHTDYAPIRRLRTALSVTHNCLDLWYICIPL